MYNVVFWSGCGQFSYQTYWPNSRKFWKAKRAKLRKWLISTVHSGTVNGDWSLICNHCSLFGYKWEYLPHCALATGNQITIRFSMLSGIPASVSYAEFVVISIRNQAQFPVISCHCICSAWSIAYAPIFSTKAWQQCQKQTHFVLKQRLKPNSKSHFEWNFKKGMDLHHSLNWTTCKIA